MALSKIQAESMNLADTYAFTGTVSGAPSDFALILLLLQHSYRKCLIIDFTCFLTSTYVSGYRIYMRVEYTSDNQTGFYMRLLDSQMDS
jgi:hypothetical protein